MNSHANSFFDQAKLELDAAKADLDLRKAELEAAQSRYDEAMEHLDDSKQRFIEADLLRPCRWNSMFHELLKWINRNGDTIVPTSKNSTDDEKKLAKWVQNQRVFYKYYMNGDTKHIKQHRIDALNNIGFVWNVFEHQWNANFEALKEYYAENNTFDVPRKENAKLSGFVTSMRSAMIRRNEGLVQKEITLTDERIDKLNSINFDWESKRPTRKKKSPGVNIISDYDHHYQLLASFKEEYDHVKVSKMLQEWGAGIGEPSNAEYKRLPTFVAAMRKEHERYRDGQPSVLTEERVEQLTALGVKWKKPPNEPRQSTSKKGDDPNRETRKRRRVDDVEDEETEEHFY